MADIVGKEVAMYRRVRFKMSLSVLEQFLKNGYTGIVTSNLPKDTKIVGVCQDLYDEMNGEEDQIPQNLRVLSIHGAVDAPSLEEAPYGLIGYQTPEQLPFHLLHLPLRFLAVVAVSLQVAETVRDQPQHIMPGGNAPPLRPRCQTFPAEEDLSCGVLEWSPTRISGVWEGEDLGSAPAVPVGPSQLCHPPLPDEIYLDERIRGGYPGSERFDEVRSPLKICSSGHPRSAA